MLSVVCGIFSLACCSARDEKKSTMETRAEMPADPPAKVVKTDAEWKQMLSPEQYRILRQSGTESPNGEVYKEFKHQGKGTYHCAGCGALLFSSAQKFDSGCGWPSFYDPAKADNVVPKKDASPGLTRLESPSAKCGRHPGHVFEGEGYHTPTDKRFCINGGGLTFVPAEGRTPIRP